MTSSWFPAKLLEANCKPEKHEHQAKPQQWGLATLMTLPREKWSSDSGLFLVWMWTGVGMCTRAFGGSGWCCWSSSIIFYLRLWDWVSHWSWGSLIRQDWLASMPWGICLSPHLQYCDYMSMLLSDFFLCRCLCVNLVPHVCTTSTLLTEPSPKCPSIHVFQCIEPRPSTVVSFLRQFNF